MARLLTLYEEGEKKEYRGGGYKGGGAMAQVWGFLRNIFDLNFNLYPETL